MATTMRARFISRSQNESGGIPAATGGSSAKISSTNVAATAVPVMTQARMRPMSPTLANRHAWVYRPSRMLTATRVATTTPAIHR